MKGKSDMRMPEEFLEIDATEAELSKGSYSETIQSVGEGLTASGVGLIAIGITARTACNSWIKDVIGDKYHPEQMVAAQKGKTAGWVMAAVGATTGLTGAIMLIINNNS